MSQDRVDADHFSTDIQEFIRHRIEGVLFEEAWAGRREVFLAFESDTVPMYYIGLEQLITNKESIGRPKDRDDLTFLKEIRPQESD